MKGYSYYNGRYFPYNSEEIGTFDRAVFFGDGVYDVMIGGNGVIYQKKLHLDRLKRNISALNIPFSYTDQQLNKIFRRLIEYTNFDTFIIYIQVSRYAEIRLHESGDDSISNLLVSVTPYTIPDRYTTYSLITEQDIRHRLCNIKTLNLLPAVLAARKARSRGCDGAVFILNNTVTECAHSNIFILKNGTLFTHKEDNCILPGIMRHNLINTANRLNIPVMEKAFTKEELFTADEVIITSTTKFAKRVSLIDGINCGMSDSGISGLLIDELYSDFLDFIS